MSTKKVFGAHILRYLMVLVYFINISFQVLYKSNLERFLVEICVLIVLSNIQMYSKFYLVSI